MNEVVRFDPFLQSHRGWVIGGSAVVPPLACWLLSIARDSVANTTAALGLMLLVVLAAATGIRMAGIVAALSSTAGFDFFLTEPFHTFTIIDTDDLETAVLLLLVGAAVSEIAIWGRRQQAHASREQGYLDGLLGTAGAVAAGDAPTGELIDLVRAQIITLLHIDSCRFTSSTHYGLPTLADDGTVNRGGHIVDVSRKGLPTDTGLSLRVRSGGTTYGHFLLTASTRVVRPTRNQLKVAVMLADQVGAAIAVGERPRPSDSEDLGIPRAEGSPGIPSTRFSGP